MDCNHIEICQNEKFLENEGFQNEILLWLETS